MKGEGKGKNEIKLKNGRLGKEIKSVVATLFSISEERTNSPENDEEDNVGEGGPHLHHHMDFPGTYIFG